MKVKFKLELFHVDKNGKEVDCFSIVGGSADNEDIDAALALLMTLKEQRQEIANENNCI